MIVTVFQSFISHSIYFFGIQLIILKKKKKNSFIEYRKSGNFYRR